MNRHHAHRLGIGIGGQGGPERRRAPPHPGAGRPVPQDDQAGDGQLHEQELRGLAHDLIQRERQREAVDVVENQMPQEPAVRGDGHDRKRRAAQQQAGPEGAQSPARMGRRHHGQDGQGRQDAGLLGEDREHERGHGGMGRTAEVRAPHGEAQAQEAQGDGERVHPHQRRHQRHRQEREEDERGGGGARETRRPSRPAADEAEGQIPRQRGGGERRQQRNHPSGDQPVRAQFRQCADDQVVDGRIMKHDERIAVDVAVHPRARDQHGLLPDDALGVVDLERIGRQRHGIADVEGEVDRQRQQRGPPQYQEKNPDGAVRGIRHPRGAGGRHGLGGRHGFGSGSTARGEGAPEPYGYRRRGFGGLTGAFRKRFGHKMDGTGKRAGGGALRPPARGGQTLSAPTSPRR